jgi:two-component system, sensor histidine kinase and response regulator
MTNTTLAVCPMQLETMMHPTVISPHILLADDDIEAMIMLGDILKPLYSITFAQDGEKALRLLENNQFDLIMLDVVMWGMGGLEVLSAIRSRPATADLPVILVSALSTHDAIVKGLQNGANDYITKPFDPDIVKARIKNQVDMKRLLDEREQTIAFLKNSHETKDRFLRIATHDLKSPLNNIRLAQYYLREILDTNPTAIDALDIIEDTVNTMTELVDDFLDSSALESGKAELQLEQVEVETLLWNVIARYSATASRKNITLLLGKSQGMVVADYTRLEQIVSNLVSNAIKYSPPDGIVTVSSGLMNDQVRISVADEGSGIPPEERPQLFQAFSKLSNRPTGGENSTGLGLWIVKELAQMHQGTAGADFPADGGSVFWVDLPVSNGYSAF